MKVLVIAAHGSRKASSNLEVEKLAERLAGKLKNSFEKVTHAFLQFADPLLETVLDDLAKEGAVKIVVFPFFIGCNMYFG